MVSQATSNVFKPYPPKKSIQAINPKKLILESIQEKYEISIKIFYLHGNGNSDIQLRVDVDHQVDIDSCDALALLPSASSKSMKKQH
jgi:histidinol phosphatase-like enzyme